MSKVSAVLRKLLWLMLKWFVLYPALFLTLSFLTVSEATKAGVYIEAQANDIYQRVLAEIPVSLKNNAAASVQGESKDVRELIKDISKAEGISPVITEAMALQESGELSRTDRVNEEPALLKPYRDRDGKLRPARIRPPQGLNQIEKQMWASSHGLMQIIYGFHKERCGLKSFTELYDPETNIRCAIKILKENLKTYDNVRNPRQKLQLALRDYNGSGPDADAYAASVIANIDRLRAKDLPPLALAY